MNWKLFIAGRIYRSKEGGKEMSRPAIRIATAGVAIGLAVMIVAVAIVIGFKRQVRNKVVGVSSDVVVTNFDQQKSYETIPIEASDSLLQWISDVPGVAHVQRYATKPGMIMTDDNFLGMVLKGVGEEFDNTYMKAHLVEGKIPSFSDSVASNRVLVSEPIAGKLKLKVGDRIYTYYVDNDDVRARRLEIAGIYKTNLSMYDDLFLLTDIYTVNRLNGWETGQVSGIEIDLNKGNIQMEPVEEIIERIDMQEDNYGGIYYVRTIEEVHPQVFAWLNLLDMNVWVILVLMLGVAGFTMISGLLIIILERTSMIGILKSMGADNASVRKVFLHLSVYLIGRGMLWGNAIALLFILIQHNFRLVKLDSTIYYIDSVPVELNIWLYLLLNIGTLIVSVLMLVGPSYLIANIHPAKSIRFD